VVPPCVCQSIYPLEGGVVQARTFYKMMKVLRGYLGWGGGSVAAGHRTFYIFSVPGDHYITAELFKRRDRRGQEQQCLRVWDTYQPTRELNSERLGEHLETLLKNNGDVQKALGVRLGADEDLIVLCNRKDSDNPSKQLYVVDQKDADCGVLSVSTPYWQMLRPQNGASKYCTNSDVQWFRAAVTLSLALGKLVLPTQVTV
jgi:hypothetical protein